MNIQYANHMQTQTLTCAKVQQTKISHGNCFFSICKPPNLGDSEEFWIILSWHILFLCLFYVPHIPGSICWSQILGQEKVYTLKKSLQWFTWFCLPMMCIHNMQENQACESMYQFILVHTTSIDRKISNCFIQYHTVSYSFISILPHTTSYLFISSMTINESHSRYLVWDGIYFFIPLAKPMMDFRRWA